ncbi:MAG TPA: hypothetical protein VN520_25685 [Streptomyces sp.]|uniref:hypothetical protein n=1 Tax=Streptomyces sp. TaxID=1931 RepID=UPI002B99264D|nr:hypothetical protein [Streptomyces sp.]HWU09727.1 hypothetical protein [Streptomyces sp.]
MAPGAAVVAAPLAIGMLTAVDPAPAEAARVDTGNKAVEVQSASTADGGDVVRYADRAGAGQ